MDNGVIILGAGLAGLSLGSTLAKAGVPVRVIEKESYVGGLAASFKSGPFTYDLGPHRFHSHNDDILNHVKGILGENFSYRDRMSRIFMEDQFFNYPLKTSNVLKNLPITFLIKAFSDYLIARMKNRFSPVPDDCFENWVTKRFGRTLSQMFFITYTEKTWGIPANEISADWAAQRITLLNLWDTIKKTIFKPKNAPRTLVSKFIYPINGGIGAICEEYARIIKENGGEITLGAKISGIEVKGGKAQKIDFIADGKNRTYEIDRLVSTIPCTVLLKYINPAPPAAVLEANANLKHVGIVFVFMDVDAQRVTKDHWIYLPTKDLTVHRISEFKNFSENACPPGRTMICAEITCSEGGRIWSSDAQALRKIATDDLAKVGLIDKKLVGESHIHRTPHAYPLYDLPYRANLEILIDYLNAFENLKTAGRQGLFKYNNMDHSVEMGIKLAESMLTGKDSKHNDIASDDKYFG